MEGRRRSDVKRSIIAPLIPTRRELEITELVDSTLPHPPYLLCFSLLLLPSSLHAPLHFSLFSLSLVLCSAQHGVTISGAESSRPMVSETAGQYFVVLDNTHSYVRGKTVAYSVTKTRTHNKGEEEETDAVESKDMHTRPMT
eukprot:2412331-Rhodomonas_salina.1